MQLPLAITGSAALVASPALWIMQGWKLGVASLALGLAGGLYLLLEDGSIVASP